MVGYLRDQHATEEASSAAEMSTGGAQEGSGIPHRKCAKVSCWLDGKDFCGKMACGCIRTPYTVVGRLTLHTTVHSHERICSDLWPCLIAKQVCITQGLPEKVEKTEWEQQQDTNQPLWMPSFV